MQKQELNLNRPQDYIFKSNRNTEILNFKEDEKQEKYSTSRIIVNYVKQGKFHCFLRVDIYGNYRLDQEDDFNVILRPELAEKPEIKKRKVVQISSAAIGFSGGSGLYVNALCDDGRIYWIDLFGKREWERLPELPQD